MELANLLGTLRARMTGVQAEVTRDVREINYTILTRGNMVITGRN